MNTDDPQIKELQERAAQHRARAAALRQRREHRFDNAPGSFVTGSSGRRRSGLAKRSERAMAGALNDSRKASWHDDRAAHLEYRVKWLLGEEQRSIDRLKAQADQKASRAAATRQRRAMTAQEKLFAYHCATGWAYADKSRWQDNDYTLIAILFASDLTVSIHNPCAPDLMALIEADIAKIKARVGEKVGYNGGSTYFRIGYKLPESKALDEEEDQQSRKAVEALYAQMA